MEEFQGGARKDRREGKILSEVKVTGACRCSDLARLSTQAAVTAAAVRVTHSSWRQFRYFKTISV